MPVVFVLGWFAVSTNIPNYVSRCVTVKCTFHHNLTFGFDLIGSIYTTVRNSQHYGPSC